MGQSSVTTNPLLAHTTHAVPPSADDIHFLDFAELDDHDHIHMLSWDDSEPELIVSDRIYEIGRVTLGPRMPTTFRLLSHYSVQMSFVLILDIEEV